MFTFTLTADTAEELNALIVAAAEKIVAAAAAEPAEKTIVDFPLQDLVERLKTLGFEVR